MVHPGHISRILSTEFDLHKNKAVLVRHGLFDERVFPARRIHSEPVSFGSRNNDYVESDTAALMSQDLESVLNPTDSDEEDSVQKTENDIATHISNSIDLSDSLFEHIPQADNLIDHRGIEGSHKDMGYPHMFSRTRICLQYQRPCNQVGQTCGSLQFIMNSKY